MLLLTEIIVLIIGIILIVLFAKSAVKIVAFSILLLVVIIFIGGLFIGMDIKDITQNFPDQPKTFLLEDQGEIVAGLTAIELDDFKSLLNSDNIKLHSADQIAEESELYAQKEYSELRGTSYKLFIVELDALTEDFAEFDIPKFDSSLNIAGSYNIDTAESIKEFMHSNQFMQESKDVAFAGLVANKLEETDSSFLLTGIKSRQIKVYRETPAFKALRYMPNFILKRLISTVS